MSLLNRCRSYFRADEVGDRILWFYDCFHHWPSEDVNDDMVFPLLFDFLEFRFSDFTRFVEHVLGYRGRLDNFIGDIEDEIIRTRPSFRLASIRPVRRRRPLVLPRPPTPHRIIIRDPTPPPLIIQQSPTPPPIIIQQSPTPPPIILRDPTPPPIVLREPTPPPQIVIERRKPQMVVVERSRPQVIIQETPRPRFIHSSSPAQCVEAPPSRKMIEASPSASGTNQTSDSFRPTETDNPATWAGGTRAQTLRTQSGSATKQGSSSSLHSQKAPTNQSTTFQTTYPVTSRGGEATVQANKTSTQQQTMRPSTNQPTMMPSTQQGTMMPSTQQGTMMPSTQQGTMMPSTQTTSRTQTGTVQASTTMKDTGDPRFPPENTAVTSYARIAKPQYSNPDKNNTDHWYYYTLLWHNPAPGMADLRQKQMNKGKGLMKGKGLRDDAAWRATVTKALEDQTLEMISDGPRGQLYLLKPGNEHILGAAMALGTMNGRRWTLFGLGEQSIKGSQLLIAMKAGGGQKTVSFA